MEALSKNTPSAPQVSAEEIRAKWRILWSVVIGLFMVILDETVINVALKALQTQFRVTTDQAQWVISLYTLVLGVAIPLSGYLGDRFGTKRIYLGGLSLFVIGSLLAGLAASQTSLGFLIFARGLQGLGGGIALPLGIAMMFRAFGKSEEERGDIRMVRQLDEVCIAIAEVLAQLDPPSSCASPHLSQEGDEA